LNALCHQVIVAMPQDSRITGSESKNDRNDAEKLARFAAFDPSCSPRSNIAAKSARWI